MSELTAKEMRDKYLNPQREGNILFPSMDEIGKMREIRKSDPDYGPLEEYKEQRDIQESWRDRYV